jgi:hypothetical protein
VHVARLLLIVRLLVLLVLLVLLLLVVRVVVQVVRGAAGASAVRGASIRRRSDTTVYRYASVPIRFSTGTLAYRWTDGGPARRAPAPETGEETTR